MANSLRGAGSILILPVLTALLIWLQFNPPVPAQAPGQRILLGTLTPTPTPTSTPTPTRTPTPTATATATATPSPTPTATASATATASPSPVATATAAPSPSPAPPATPAPTPLPGLVYNRVRVPILMYHYISAPPAGADIYRLDLSVTPENFEAQLAYLKEAGYTSISLADLIYHLSGRRELPDKPVIITFDDGYADNYANAFPLLKKYGFSAAFALVTQPIDFGDPRYMSWDNVVEMHAAGMEFAAHSYRHYDLRDQPLDFLVYEIVGSKEAIEARINEPVRFFVYPSGEYDRRVVEVLVSADFWGALTTAYGDEHTYPGRFELARIRIRGGDTLAEFTAKAP